MFFLVAKHVDKVGSVAIKMKADKSLTTFKASLLDKIGYEKIQLVVISRPSAYGEYAPYKIYTDPEEFRQAVYDLQ